MGLGLSDWVGVESSQGYWHLHANRYQTRWAVSWSSVKTQLLTPTPSQVHRSHLERERESERERDPLAILTHLNGFFTLEKQKAIVIVKATVKSIVCPRFSIYHYVLTLTLSQSSITYYIYFLLLDNMQGWFIVTISYLSHVLFIWWYDEFNNNWVFWILCFIFGPFWSSTGTTM